MGAILCTGCSTSDSHYFSGSIWWRTPTPDSVSLLTISDTDFNTSTYITAAIGPTTGYGFHLDSDESISAGESATILCHTSLSAGVWNHLAFGIDVNHVGTHSPSTDPCIANAVCNGVTKTMTLGANGGINFPPAGPVLINFFGQSIGIPDLTNAYKGGTLGSDTAIMEFSDVQLWTQYIDWTNSTNYAKIVSVNAGKGTPVSPAISAATFGQQQWLFKGNHTQFKNNLGTAGGTSSFIGTCADFTPAPSF